MLKYCLEKKKGKALYLMLYEYIKRDILSGSFSEGMKLPSKREMARDNGVSISTVMNAYEQLLAEGYIESIEKKGYFVGKIYESLRGVQVRSDFNRDKTCEIYADFSMNHAVYEKFPISMWKKVMREVLGDYEEELVEKSDFRGVKELREALADYLYRSRGMEVDSENIVIGAGVEYLYDRLFKILPDDAVYAAENPGYKKIPSIYRDSRVSWKYVDMDEEGINMLSLRNSGASVVHLSADHHYPLNVEMTKERRRDILEWVREQRGRYIIEDDYDCEFRYHSCALPALQTEDYNHRVIYMNTYSKTLAPSIRVSYMILPGRLMEYYTDSIGKFANSVPNSVQYTLARFIREGYFERNLSRMRKYYNEQGEKLYRAICQCKKLPVKWMKGRAFGTHLLVKLETTLTDAEVRWAGKEAGIHLSFLSEFCIEIKPQYEHVLVMHYLDLDEELLDETIEKIANIFVC